MAKSGQHGGNTLQMAARFGLSPEQITDFSANINPLGMPASLKQTLSAALDSLQHYPDIEYRALHSALAAHHHCNVSQVLAGNGATELIFNWVQYARPQKALLVEPGFAEYRRALSRYGCHTDTFYLREEEGFALTGRFLSALNDSYDCLFLCTPNNPTGLMPDKALLNDIVGRCAALGIRLVVDESFTDFIEHAPSLIAGLSAHPHVYILRSLTKFYAIPGLRLGYLVSADTTLLDQIRAEREPWTINALAALAGEVLFSDAHYCQQTYRWLAREQQVMVTALSAIPALTVYPPTANYLFFKVNQSNIDLQSALMRRGLLIRHCANYPGLNQQFYRVAIKSSQDNQMLIQALHQVLNNG